jgi:ATP-dependent Clp protease ATP-binding subunit ClpA
VKLFRRAPVTVASADRYFRLGVEQARRLGQSHIGSEHVLLGLASDSSGAAAAVLEQVGATPKLIETEIRADPTVPPRVAIDAQALATLGIDLDAVRARVDEQFGQDALEHTHRGCRPVEPSLKRALADAVAHAGGLPPTDMQVLAALVAVPDSAAIRVLGRLGVVEQDVVLALHTD